MITVSNFRHKMKSIADGDAVALALGSKSGIPALLVIVGTVNHKNDCDFDLVRPDGKVEKVEDRVMMSVNLPVLALVKIRSVDDLAFAQSALKAELGSVN